MHCYVDIFFSLFQLLYIYLPSVGLLDFTSMSDYLDIQTILSIYVELAYNSSNFVILFLGLIS